MIKQAAPYFTWGKAPGSYLNTLNPVSGMFGGGDRIPGWWMAMFDTTSSKKQIHAALAFKSLACSLLAASLVGVYRAIKHFNRISEMAEADSPAKKLRSQISTTFEGGMTPQTEEELAALDSQETKTASQPDKRYVNMPPFSVANLISMSIPLGASLLAASMAYGAVDSWASARRNRKLDTAIKAKSNATKALMQTRARIAKGLATDEEVQSALNALDDEDLYIKEASGRGILEAGAQTLVSTYGLIGSLLLIASAVGGYKYFSAADLNNIKYKVSKRSLADYARNKTNMTPVTVVPTDTKEYFATIDEGQKPNEQQEMRELPQMPTEATGTPVTVTL